jgi:hypothetical protein
VEVVALLVDSAQHPVVQLKQTDVRRRASDLRKSISIPAVV